MIVVIGLLQLAILIFVVVFSFINFQYTMFFGLGILFTLFSYILNHTKVPKWMQWICF